MKEDGFTQRECRNMLEAESPRFLEAPATQKQIDRGGEHLVSILRREEFNRANVMRAIREWVEKYGLRLKEGALKVT